MIFSGNKRSIQFGGLVSVCLILLGITSSRAISPLEVADASGSTTPATQPDPKKYVIATYDIHDLLFDPDPADAPDLSVSNGTSATNIEAGQTIDDLTHLTATRIRNTVDYDSWGNGAQIEEKPGKLIILQSPENQAVIAKIFANVRRWQSVDGQVEARFIEANPGSSPQSMNLLIAASTPHDQQPNVVQRDAMPNPFDDAGSSNSNAHEQDVPEVGLLSTSDVDELLRKLQNDKNIKIAVSSLILHSGDNGYSFQGNSHGYLAAVAMAGSGNNVFYQPRFARCLAGKLFDISSMSANPDRSNCSFGLRAQWSRLESIEAVSVAADPHLNYQRPIISLSDLTQMRLSIPSGSAVLLAMPATVTTTLKEQPSQDATTSPKIITSDAIPAPRIFLLIQPIIVDRSAMSSRN